VLNVLCSFSSINVIISSILVMIGHVTEIRHMYQFGVPTSEDFLLLCKLQERKSGRWSFNLGVV